MKCKCDDLEHIKDDKYVCNNCKKKWRYNRWLSCKNLNPWEEQED